MLNQMSIISRLLHFYMKQLQSVDSGKMSQILLSSDALRRYVSLGNQPVSSELSLVTRVLDAVSSNQILSQQDKLFIVSRIEFVMDTYLSEAVDEMRDCYQRCRKQFQFGLKRIGDKSSIKKCGGDAEELEIPALAFISCLYC